MLIEFSVKNFLSFKESVSLSMVAAKLNAIDERIDKNNTFLADQDLRLLTSAAIYGANGSGKSNLLKAFKFMRWFVLNSSKESQAQDPIDTIPFGLDSKTEQTPSFFEVVFINDGIPYRYGFEVTRKKVETEWLFYTPNIKEIKLFLREGNDINPKRDFKGGRTAKSFTRPNALFLSVAAQFNNVIATKVLSWFRSVLIISGLDDKAYRDFTATKFMEDKNFKENIIELIQNFDAGIDGVNAELIDIKDPDTFPKNISREFLDSFINKNNPEQLYVTFKTIHKKQCENGAVEEVEFDMNFESEGTQKLFKLSGPIIEALANGRLLVVDEIEARLHTLITRKLIGLFNSEVTNPKHAQLIFATHDTNILTNKVFRRDQIWFIEKDEFGASHLYSLAGLKVRNDASFDKEYLDGQYGSIPILGEMRQIMIDQGFENEE